MRFLSRFVTSVAARAPSLVILAALGAVVVLGHHFDWKIPGLMSRGNEVRVDPPESAHTRRPHRQEGAGEDTVVRLASGEAVGKTSLRLSQVQLLDMPVFVTAGGSIQYDRTRFAQLSSRVSGTVFEVLVRVGDTVRAGEPLALIESPEVGRAKADFVQALVLHELKKQIASAVKEAESVVPPKRLLETQSALREARLQEITAQQALLNLGLRVEPESYQGLSDEELMKKLRHLGLPSTSVRRLGDMAGSANLIALLAPFSGQVVSVDLVQGEAITAGHPKVTVADMNAMWVVLDVPVDEAARLRVGQEMVFRPDSLDGLEVKTEIAWISTEADPKTRRIRVRGDAGNSHRMLRANSFGSGQIKVRQETKTLAVAADALHWDMDRQTHVVFVSVDERTFEARAVRAGARQGPMTEVLPVRAGSLQAGDRIAVEGSYLLKSEVLRQRLASAH